LLVREYLKYLRALARTNWERFAGADAGGEDEESSAAPPRGRWS
jgi:hypothetical protein